MIIFKDEEINELYHRVQEAYEKAIAASATLTDREIAFVEGKSLAYSHVLHIMRNTFAILIKEDKFF